MYLRAFLFWIVIATLAVGGWYGQYVLRRDPSEAGRQRYRRFGYTFAVAFGLMPVITGDWQWSLVAVPAALLVMHFWILGRDKAP